MSQKNELKPWKIERFCITPPDRARFVAAMEAVLDIYHEAFDQKHPLVCMDEAARQYLSDKFDPLPVRPGKAKRVDDKYDRHGTCSLFMFYNPTTGWRRVSCRESRTAVDWAEEVKYLLDEVYPDAELVTLVCDNLNTHHIASLYKAFDAATAHRLARRLRLIHTPINGSWLNIAEMELSILSRQCLGQTRFQNKAAIETQINAWQTNRNQNRAGTNWQFSTTNARNKLRSLYPIPDIQR